jgi:hypothetical protein
LISTARAACHETLGLPAHLVLVLRDRRIEQRGRFRQIGRNHQRARDQHALEHIDRLRRNQPIARSRDHYRVEHHARLPPAHEAGRDGFDHRRLGEHADLHRIDVEIGKHRVHLRGNEIGRHIVDRGNARRVLGGERGDDRGPQTPSAEKVFRVGLNAGTTARDPTPRW